MRADKLRYVRFDFGHNYNQTSREAVYDWFGKWLLKQSRSCLAEGSAISEGAGRRFAGVSRRQAAGGRGERGPDHRVSEGSSPGAVGIARGAGRGWPGEVQAGHASPPGGTRCRSTGPPARCECRAENVRESGEFTAATLKISRSEGGPAILASYWAPPGIRSNSAPKVVVICSGNDAAAPAGCRG